TRRDWSGSAARRWLGCPLLLAEEPGRPDDEEHDQEDEAVKILVRGREEHRAQRFEDAEEHAAHDAPEDRAEPADDDDLEALEGRDRAVLGIDEEVRREQRPGGGGQRDAD